MQNAVDQAEDRCRMQSWESPQAYDPVPWFWSDQYEIKLQITGLLDGFDSRPRRSAVLADAKFSVEYRKDGKLIAVDAINDGRAHMMGRRRIAADLPEVRTSARLREVLQPAWVTTRARRVVPGVLRLRPTNSARRR